MKLLVLPWLLLGMLLNVAAQLLLKAGSARISGLSFNWANAMRMGFELMTSPCIVMGCSCYVISVVIWIGVLSRAEVSVAYPLMSLGYVITAIAAYYLFGETLTLSRLSGIGLILIGVCLMTRG